MTGDREKEIYATLSANGLGSYADEVWADLEKMRARIKMYENILSRTPPHVQIYGETCHAAKKDDRLCCNPKCQGNWGTGCYCCHHGKYALHAGLDEDPGPYRRSR